MATSAPQLGSWFSWASYIRELEPGTPLRPGKQLLLGYQLPLVGDYVFTATVTEVQEGRWHMTRLSIGMMENVYSAADNPSVSQSVFKITEKAPSKAFS